MGQRLVELRERRDLNQVEVAEAVGIGRPFLSSIENGKKDGSISTIAALADFYDVSLDYLYSGKMPSSQADSDDIAHNEEERLLLKIWRIVDDDERHSLMVLLRAQMLRKNDAA